MNPLRKFNISVFVIWLFTISGILGISSGYQEWFLALTPLNLLVYLGAILWNGQFQKRLILALFIAFGIGMVTEYLGVNYGLIFGNYTYGNNLGYTVEGVPWMIGVNWAVLVYCTAAIAKKFFYGILVTSCMGAMLMTGLDVVIEVSAPRFDFWQFEGGTVPLQNYIGWFFTAFAAQFFFQKTVPKLNIPLGIHLFAAISLFFLIFLFI